MANEENKELSDFIKLPFTGSMYWEDLDKDFLIRVMLMWSGAVEDLTGGIGGYHGIIAKRWGWDTAIEITKEVWENYAQKHIPQYADIAKTKPQNLVDVLQTIFLSPDGSTRSRKATEEDVRDKTIRAQQEVINPNYIRAQCDWCNYLDDFIKEVEEIGIYPEVADKMIKDICTMDVHLGACYFEAGLPGRKVEGRLIKAPSVKTKGEAPVCIQEYEVVER